jgi:hypothetical protein
MSDANAMQGCGPDCRAAEQGYPAVCEMYPNEHHAGCPRQSKAECCNALTLHAYDCNRVSVSGSPTSETGERFGEDETRWQIMVTFRDGQVRPIATYVKREHAEADFGWQCGYYAESTVTIVRAVTTRTIEPSSTQGVNNG